MKSILPLSLTLLTACGGKKTPPAPAAAPEPPPVETPVEDPQDSLLAELGITAEAMDFCRAGFGFDDPKSLDDVIAALGEPDADKVTPYESPHVEGLMIDVHEMSWPGVEVVIDVNTESGRAAMLRIEVEREGYEMAEGLQIGDSLDEVIDALGEPSVEADGEATWGCEADTFTFLYGDEGVERVRWDLYVD